MEVNDLLSKLNDRALSFPSRCSYAASLLSDSHQSWSFPRKTQYIFDWFTSTLIKLARSNPPHPDIFLSAKVWNLMKLFSNILTENSNISVSLKRPLKFITNDDEFFDFKRSFDPQNFIIKCPLLTIFQTSLSLLSIPENGSNNYSIESDDSLVESEIICHVILAFVQQNRVSLPVSFSQVTEFIHSLVQSRPKSFCEVLRPTLGILSEIIIGGSANYKKTFPLLVKFCLQIQMESSSTSVEEKGIWIDFIEKCLFSQEFIDELLNFMTCPAMIKILESSEGEDINESSFPKSLTFQRSLFIELATTKSAAESCPLLYEAFLRSAGSKINRETGFNFFLFLLKKCLNPKDLDPLKRSDQLAKLIFILQSRGNEIYQQRNDEIYRKQSATIEEIFSSAITGKNISGALPYSLLLSIAKLNYYLVLDKLEIIFDIAGSSDLIKSCEDDFISFIIGIFELSALANQLPILLQTILKSKLPFSVLKMSELQLSLVKILRNSLSPFSLHQVYLSLVSEASKSKSAILLLIPVMRSIVKIVDNIESFDKENFQKFQKELLASKNEECLNLFAEIVRWTPGTFLLINVNEDDLSHFPDYILCTLKCKGIISRVLIKEISNDLILKYLPLIAGDMNESDLKSFSRWLLINESDCLKVLSKSVFFEIIPLRDTFLLELVSYIKSGEACFGYISKIIVKLPWEFLKDEITAELIKSLWRTPLIVSQLLKVKDRKKTLEILKETDCNNFIEFLINYGAEIEDDLISKCFQIERSLEFVKSTLETLKQSSSSFKAKFLSKMIKYIIFDIDFDISIEILKFIRFEIDPIKLMKQKEEPVCVGIIDALDIILEWVLNNQVLDDFNNEEFIAKCILNLPESSSLDVSVRCQALKCKFPARNDLEFIEESIELASKLSDSPEVNSIFRKDLLSLIKGLPIDRIKFLIESFINSSNNWRFSFGLQAINQFIHVTAAAPEIFSLFKLNIDDIYESSLKFDIIPTFLASLKSIVQLKKNVTWESEIISNILGVLRRTRQSRPQCYEEIFSILRLIISLHIRKFKSLIPLLVSNICESFCDVKSCEESNSFGRVLSELGSMKRTELEPFALLPLSHTFIITKYPNMGIKKPIQLAMTSLMYHLGGRKQLLQLLSTALVTEHEHRLILKAFIDEYNKFHKYSGRA